MEVQNRRITCFERIQVSRFNLSSPGMMSLDCHTYAAFGLQINSHAGKMESVAGDFLVIALLVTQPLLNAVNSSWSVCMIIIGIAHYVLHYQLLQGYFLFHLLLSAMTLLHVTVQVDKCVVAEQSIQSLSTPLPQRTCPPVHSLGWSLSDLPSFLQNNRPKLNQLIMMHYMSRCLLKDSLEIVSWIAGGIIDK